MKSDHAEEKRGVRQWADLPPDLLSLISACLQDAADIIRFRSICRSWRSSTAPLLHKVSPFFPARFPTEAYNPSADRDSHPKFHDRLTEIQASAVYLLRPRRDPSKAWMVHVQEYSPGKLIFRHAVTLKELELPVGNWPDLSSDEWSSVTRIVRTYNRFDPCSRCKGLAWMVRLALVLPNSSSPRSGLNQLVRLGSAVCTWMSIFAYIRGGGSTTATSKWVSSLDGISDLAQFNGKIYAIRDDASLYVLDYTTSKLIILVPGSGGTIDRHPGKYNPKYLVVWDGGLYIVVVDYPVRFLDCYRLVGEGEGNCRWERVEDLGDGVFFITRNCAFSMSARDLPSPWRRNSIVYYTGFSMFCLCVTWKVKVFELGVEGAQFMPFSSFDGYSNLFVPPLTCT